jgi:ferric-dicitrate binding protein FerR (iron transport regulator)
MHRSHFARLCGEPVSVTPGTSITTLGVLRQKLEVFNTSRHSTCGTRAKRAACAEAVHWLNELDEADHDRLDELWPQFEAWVMARPENQEMVLAVERTRNAMEELTAWCPPEGSEAADRLLHLSDTERRRGSVVRAIAQWVLIAIPLALSAVALWLIVH